MAVNLTEQEIITLGKSLGADVVPCLYNKAVLAEGIGEILTPTSVEFPKAVLVATPHCAVPTKDAYAGVVPSGKNRWNTFKSNWNGTLSFEFYNKFEESVFPRIYSATRIPSTAALIIPPA